MKVWRILSCIILAVLTVGEYAFLIYMTADMLKVPAKSSGGSHLDILFPIGTVIIVMINCVGAYAMYHYLVQKIGIYNRIALEWTLGTMLLALPTAMVLAMLSVILSGAIIKKSIWNDLLFLQVLFGSPVLCYWSAVALAKRRLLIPGGAVIVSNGTQHSAENVQPSAQANNTSEHFTQRARRIILLGQEASKLHSAEIHLEHLLLGLLLEQESIAAQVLQQAGATTDQIRKEIGATGYPTGEVDREEIKLARATVRVLEIAADEAKTMRSRFIGPEHLLLALCDNALTETPNLLKRLNLNPVTIRAQVMAQYKNQSDHEAQQTIGLARSEYQDLLAHNAEKDARISELEARLAKEESAPENKG